VKETINYKIVDKILYIGLVAPRNWLSAKGYDNCVEGLKEIIEERIANNCEEMRLVFKNKKRRIKTIKITDEDLLNEEHIIKSPYYKGWYYFQTPAIKEAQDEE
jgi:hypothetical protein